MLQIQTIFFISKKHFLKKILYKKNIPPSSYEIESLNNEIKRIIIDKGHYTQADYPFTIKQKFSTLGGIIEIKPQGAIIGFVFDDSIRNLLGFPETILFKKCNLSDNPVDILSFDNIFLECDIAKGMLFRGKKVILFIYVP